MKTIFAVLLAALCAPSAFATEAEGGTGLSRPGDYYNPDYKCSVKDGMTLYINVAPEFELSATVYNKRSGQVKTTFLKLDYAYMSNESRVYRIEPSLNDSDVGYLQMNAGIQVLNTQGQLVSDCERIGRRIDEGPYYP